MLTTRSRRKSAAKEDDRPLLAPLVGSGCHLIRSMTNIQRSGEHPALQRGTDIPCITCLLKVSSIDGQMKLDPLISTPYRETRARPRVQDNSVSTLTAGNKANVKAMKGRRAAEGGEMRSKRANIGGTVQLCA